MLFWRLCCFWLYIKWNRAEGTIRFQFRLMWIWYKTLKIVIHKSKQLVIVSYNKNFAILNCIKLTVFQVALGCLPSVLAMETKADLQDLQKCLLIMIKSQMQIEKANFYPSLSISKTQKHHRHLEFSTTMAITAGLIVRVQTSTQGTQTWFILFSGEAESAMKRFIWKQRDFQYEFYVCWHENFTIVLSAFLLILCLINNQWFGRLGVVNLLCILYFQ